MKILIGMSGGLDSTYAAYLLRQQGHDVVGAVLRMHEYTETAEAAAAAQAAGIPLVEADCTSLFASCVQEPFCGAYICGKTPNPCVLCNRDVKFAGLLSYAKEHGFDRIATGHYSRIARVGDRFAVCRAADASKDQSYVLWRLTQEQLAALTTPLADLCKEDVRAAAAALGWSVAHKKDSQEICFIPDHDYAAFIERRYGVPPEGDFIDETGKVVGRHRGILHYTVGQRKHLGIALGHPVYVSRIDPAANTVTLSPAGGEFCTSTTLSDLVFQALPPVTGDPVTVRADVKIRYAAAPAPATITLSSAAATVVFDTPVRAVTPGQSAVAYRDGMILFGGTID